MQVLDLCEKATPANPAVKDLPDLTEASTLSDPGLANSGAETEPVQEPRRSFWRRSTGRLAIMALIVLTVRIFIGEASVVPTGSMEGTILVGDHLFMDKLLYGPEIPIVHWRLPRLRGIHRGDIIVFRYPKDPSETYLKRVAAVGGDTLEIRNGTVYVN